MASRRSTSSPEGDSPPSARAIRSAFLEFFEKRGHRVVPSSPLIPARDPSLLFTNAGMVPFKRYFTGEEAAPYPRATSAQKCVRAGGKHNDLERVGKTARHHTFFEMLGNFSFGDYFKEDAIRFAWEFLTAALGLPRERLWVTVYEQDDEAAALWKRIAGLGADRLVRMGEKDNFWAMGDEGPCGPCSEILVDQAPLVPPCTPGCAIGVCDCDRWLEVWNLVFMQYDRSSSGVLAPLPRPSIDTGMGLERIAAVLQGKRSNFETDLFEPLLALLTQMGDEHAGRDWRNDAAAREATHVIADHARSAAFLVTDGVMPSNEGRGYVLRRIIRRAVRYGRFLGLKDPFLHKVAARVVEEMGGAYPELAASRKTMQDLVRAEEEQFLATLGRGVEIFLEEEARVGAGGVISGDVAFRLYDTYGFPLDLTQDMARERGLRVDTSGFDREMSAQRERGRASWRGEEGAAVPEIQTAGEATAFVGYDRLEEGSEVQLLVEEGEGRRTLTEAPAGRAVWAVTRATPFYPEGGGQVGDQGEISWDGGMGQGRMEVFDTRRWPGGLIGHRGRILEGALRKGTPVRLCVNAERRQAAALHHTGTHLLHAALRRVLGTHVRQAGSLVEPARLRFDFHHTGSVSREEIQAVEDMVNEKIREDLPVEKAEMPYEEALRSGALAFFGEKYGDRVRVVRVGDFSVELCGGTHLQRTGEIGLLKLVDEEGVAAGVRRVEALGGEPALDRLRHLEAEIASAASLLEVQPAAFKDRLEQLLAESRAREAAFEQLERRLTDLVLKELVPQAREMKGVPVLAARLDELGGKALRDAAERARDKMGSGLVVLASAQGGKAQLVAFASKDLKGRVHAGNLVRDLSKALGGSGGGRPDMGQGGGPDAAKLDESLKNLDRWL